jgi:VWFA-related protein
MFRATVAFLLVLSASPLIAQFVEHVDVSIANIDVVVTDRSGKPVHGLTRDDFVVRENGRVQSITNFSEYGALKEVQSSAGFDTSTPPSPAAQQQTSKRLFILFIDIADMEPGRRKEFFEGVRSFLDATVRTEDLTAVLTWSHRLRVLVPPTSNAAAVRDLLLGMSVPFGTARDVDRIANAARVAAAAADADAMRASGMVTLTDPAAEAEFVQWRAGEERCAKTKRKLRELRNSLVSFAAADLRKVLIFASDDLSLIPWPDCLTTPELEALATTANAY